MLKRRALPDYLGFARLYLCGERHTKGIRIGLDARGSDVRPALKHLR